jgi:4-diphosphocytidyl-2-C-methyl-D-erythritol kinase
MEPLLLNAFAKINLDLRILGTRPDGYHDLRTIFQTLALSDRLTFTPRPGPLTITCSDDSVPTDKRNLVWKAASLLRRLGMRKTGPPRDVAIHIEKKIPAQAGLGGGSADAAITLLALAELWRLDLDAAEITRIASRLGADVPFFLVGGTALGLGRGDDIYPLDELPTAHAVILRPGFGVSTVDAYNWYDHERRRARREPAPRLIPPGWPDWALSMRNDLEPVVVSHHPAIARIRQSLLDAGAAVAAMSGSGSAVFGLFERVDAARRTAADLARPGWVALSTRTLNRREYARKMGRLLAIRT